MKKNLLLLILIPITCLSQIKISDIGKNINILNKNTNSSNIDISNGLKEALNNGINKQVSKLSNIDGYYKNELVKIGMPEELKNVEKTLQKLGMKKLTDEGVKVMNRAAEDAVKEAIPIFVDAVKKLTFNDVSKILMGNEKSATDYLQNTTSKMLYQKFSPIIEKSIGKVGADKVWANLISKYNKLPLVKKVNPNINDYITNKTMEGVFKMIASEEKNIRTDLNSRNSDLLKKVFALQDKK